jgi:YVTN family beta-propeller protein
LDETTSPNRFGFSCRALISALAISSILTISALAQTPAAVELLRFDSKIGLGPVRGRIDHMAVDVAHQRLFVAELGNDSLGVVDLSTRKTIRTIGGLAEPQGVGYAPAVDTIYVANARDGSVRLFRGADYSDAGRIELGSDADNVRLDADVDRVLIGYGAGAIAIIDTRQHKEIGHIRLPAHPEGFQIGGNPKKIFANVPGTHGVLVLDGIAGTPTAKWTLAEGANFPMAFDSANGRVLVVSRNPPKLIVFAEDGSAIAKSDTCGDSDDVFVDRKRKRVYVSCGAGSIDVFAQQENTYPRVARIATVSGARTSLFVPDLDLFLLAVRATSGEPASIWAFKPQP